MSEQYKDFGYDDAAALHTAVYLLPPVMELASPLMEEPSKTRVLDVGCGNGYIASQFLALGCRVVGLDLSEQGVAIARRAHPKGRFEVLAADQHVLSNLGEAPFDIVVSTEVVEHVYAPRPYLAGCFAAMKPGGRFVCSTPYHGYLKNLIVAATGKFDSHCNPLWDGGHIKLWSRNTLGQLMCEAGLTNLQFRGAGRLPFLWKSMVMSGDRPAERT